jgi:DNA (cytosine-5)-methyltransferase 1
MVYPGQLDLFDTVPTVGSLCSGTGALDRAVPGELAWVAETNESAATVLKREHPHVPNHGDITTPDVSRFTHVDLLTSGDPCQSMSAAGRQRASDDSRFLWPDVMRIIRQVRPREIFLENVQNIVSVPLVKGGARGGVLAMRLDDLTAAGYDVRWTVLGACAIGAPHHRHRWFLRATYVGGVGTAREVKAPVKCGARRGKGRELLPSPTTADGSGGPGTSPKRTGGMNLRTAVTLLPTPRATDIGTPGRRSSEGWRPQLGQVLQLLPTPTTSNSHGNHVNGRGELLLPGVVQPEHWGKFAAAIALWGEIIGRPAPDPTGPAPKGGRRLNPALSEWMMGYPEGYLTDGASRNEALRMAGNGVVALQARAAWETLGR